MIKIMLDAGHGGIDSGASYKGLLEKNINLLVQNEMYKILKDYKCEIRRVRVDDKDVSLKARTNYANESKVDLFVSIHVNAGGGYGYETYIHNNAGGKTAKIRDIIHNHHIANITPKPRNRGKKKANFHVLRETKCSAVLIEILFIDTESQLLEQMGYLKKVAKTHADGVIKALKLEKKHTKTYLNKVVCGSFANRENAVKRVDELKSKGFQSYIERG